jgi:transposase-like protein
MITSTPATGLLSQPQPEPNLKPSTRVMRTQHQWKALLSEFNDSGLTKSAFCKKHQIATSSLYRWQQLFAERSGGATDFIDVTQPLSSTPPPAPAPVRDSDWQVELELGTGIVLRLRTT